jgi:SET domain-containing protein
MPCFPKNGVVLSRRARSAAHLKTKLSKSPSRRAAASRWIEHRASAIHGRGVYARATIPDGTRVIEYTGERITKVEAERREALRLARGRRGGDDCVYIFELNARYDLDGRTRRNVARLINHSCAPNCRADTIRGHIWIIARREIAVGEELTFDYGFAFKEWRQHPCRCGSARCAGFIVNAGQRWLLRRIPRAERAAVLRASHGL